MEEELFHAWGHNQNSTVSVHDFYPDPLAHKRALVFVQRLHAFYMRNPISNDVVYAVLVQLLTVEKGYNDITGYDGVLGGLLDFIRNLKRGDDGRKAVFHNYVKSIALVHYRNGDKKARKKEPGTSEKEAYGL